jgi:hypothetical protein
VLPPAQAGVILQAWEGGPVEESEEEEEEEEFVSVCSDYHEEEDEEEEEMVDSTTTSSTSSSAIGAIREEEEVDSEEEEEEVQIPGPRRSRFIEHMNGDHDWTPVDGDEVLGITAQEKQTRTSRLAGVVRSRVVEARDRCLLAGRRFKGKWNAAL